MSALSALAVVSLPPALDAPAGDLSPERQLLLATWLSPAFPVGGFAYSHGLETAIVEGVVADGGDVEGWVRALIERGSGWSDAVLLAAAWRAVAESDRGEVIAVAELAAALAPSRERQAETLNLGAAFLIAVEAGWPCAGIAALAAATDGRVAYPVAVGVAAAEHRVPLAAMIAGVLNAFAASLISVAVRLVPIGQTAGLKALAALQPAILDAAARAATATLDDLGSAALHSDIAAMRHETLATRIFRT